MTGASPVVEESLVGTEWELTIGPVAHGGHFVARHEGRVVFVRHALPGERVRVVVTDGTATAKFLRGDAVEILEPSADRVAAPCKHARPGGCGGCDFQHISLDAQRGLKAAVVIEQFARLARLEIAVIVQPVSADETGLRWRTRNRFAVDAAGRPGLRQARTHTIEPLEDCLIAAETVAAGVLDRLWPGVSEVAVAVSPSARVVLVDGEPEAKARLTEQAAERPWRVTGAGFWQVHPGAADLLVEAARRALKPQPGEVLVDLYSGVGLFVGSLAGDLGPTGSAYAVESDQTAVRDARRNLHDLPMVTLVNDRVDRWLRTETIQRADLIVLDPPRSGAGRAVVEQMVALEPRAIAYVACDPASLARDVATFATLGYRLDDLVAFDLFPMTHHVECVATLVRV